MKKAALEHLLEKLNELLRAHPDNQPVDLEPFEMQLHRFVEHMHVNRHVVEVFDDGLVKLSFGNGEGDKATFSKHGFAMSLTNAVALIYTLRDMMMKQGHPDPFPPPPPPQTIYYAGGSGGTYPQQSGGGGRGGAAYHTVSADGHGHTCKPRPVDEPMVTVCWYGSNGELELRKMPVSIIDEHSKPV